MKISSKKNVDTGLTLAQEKEFVTRAYENFPEASAGSTLECIGWNYQKMNFLFVDNEGAGDSRRKTVDLNHAVAGLRLLARAVKKGKLKGLGLPANFLSPENDFEVLGDWDGGCFDALAQCAVFGEVIYG